MAYKTEAGYQTNKAEAGYIIHGSVAASKAIIGILLNAKEIRKAYK